MEEKSAPAGQVTLIGKLTFVSCVNHKKMYEKLVNPPKVTFPHIFRAQQITSIFFIISANIVLNIDTFILLLYDENKNQ